MKCKVLSVLLTCVLGAVLCSSLEVVPTNADAIIDQLVRANDDFGFRLLQKLELAEHARQAFPKGNICISPFGVSSSLAMLLAGAKGTTYDQI